MMAAIDKIYGTKAEHAEFYKWCVTNRSDALPYFYPVRAAQAVSEPYPICSLPVDIDMWLLENCPLTFVVKAIKWQYNIERN